MYEPFTMKNVVSKRYFLNKAYMEKALNNFLSNLFTIEGVIVKGPFVYMIENVAEDGTIAMWIMTSVANENVEMFQKYKFDSYFGLENAVCCRVYADEMEANAEALYKKMEEKCLQDGVKIVSPVYFVKSALDTEGFYSLYASVV